MTERRRAITAIRGTTVLETNSLEQIRITILLLPHCLWFLLCAIAL